VKFTLENSHHHFEAWLTVSANQRAEVRFKMAARMRLRVDLRMLPDSYEDPYFIPEAVTQSFRMSSLINGFLFSYSR
jgi:hypothetical protein